MSRLEELIHEYCPDGVEYRTLGEITEFIRDGTHASLKDSEKGFPLLSAKDIYDGIVHVPLDCRKISYGDYKEIYKNYSLSCNDVVLTIVGTIGRTALIENYCKDVAFQRSVAIIRPSNKVLPRFLVHVLRTKDVNNQIKKGTNQSAQGGIYLNRLSKIEIPLPPLPVQEEIVRILDSFTSLTAELEAELEARKKQYEYYRDKILASNKEEVPIVPLSSCCSFVRGPFGGSLKKEIFVSNGYAVYEQQNAIYQNFNFRYFITEDKYQEMKRFQVNPNDLIMSCSGTMGKVAVIPQNAPKGIINQALLKITPDPNLLSKYLKYIMESSFFSNQLMSNTRGGAIKNVASVSELKQLKIPLPSLEQQNHIISLLDHFDILCTDLTSGLPAEIETRQKQYEYYRDKLLTFKRLEEE